MAGVVALTVSQRFIGNILLDEMSAVLCTFAESGAKSRELLEWIIPMRSLILVALAVLNLSACGWMAQGNRR